MQKAVIYLIEKVNKDDETIFVGYVNCCYCNDAHVHYLGETLAELDRYINHRTPSCHEGMLGEGYELKINDETEFVIMV
jgi:hypothetical protein